MLHEHEEPNLGVLGSLDDAPPACRLTRIADCISDRAFVSECALFRSQPASGERLVGENEYGNECDDKRDGPLEDEEPPPACNSGLVHVSTGDTTT